MNMVQVEQLGGDNQQAPQKPGAPGLHMHIGGDRFAVSVEKETITKHVEKIWQFANNYIQTVHQHQNIEDLDINLSRHWITYRVGNETHVIQETEIWKNKDEEINQDRNTASELFMRLEALRKTIKADIPLKTAKHGLEHNRSPHALPPFTAPNNAKIAQIHRLKADDYLDKYHKDTDHRLRKEKLQNEPLSEGQGRAKNAFCNVLIAEYLIDRLKHHYETSHKALEGVIKDPNQTEEQRNTAEKKLRKLNEVIQQLLQIHTLPIFAVVTQLKDLKGIPKQDRTEISQHIKTTMNGILLKVLGKDINNSKKPVYNVSKNYTFNTTALVCHDRYDYEQERRQHNASETGSCIEEAIVFLVSTLDNQGGIDDFSSFGLHADKFGDQETRTACIALTKEALKETQEYAKLIRDHFAAEHNTRPNLGVIADANNPFPSSNNFKLLASKLTKKAKDEVKKKP